MFYFRIAALVTIVIITSGATLLTQSQPTFFRFTEKTGKEATVFIPNDATILVNRENIEIGDEIGVFTPDSLCVGAVVWQDSSTSVITVWGNDEMTTTKDGIDIGEQMHFRIWRRSVNTQYKQDDVRFSDSEPATGDDTYVTNGVYIVDLLTAEQVIVSVPHLRNSAIPHSFALEQNYPNPFNPSTVIQYDLPERSFVNLTVYNSLGQNVAVLVNEEHDAGFFETIFDASHLPSGVYIYHFHSGEYTESKKMLYLK